MAVKATADSLSKKLGRLFKKNNTNEIKLALPQETETAISTIANKKISFRYGYARAHESMLLGDKGQDYLTLFTQGDKFVFALCDGVSQSFYGDIAAKYLGATLLDWFNLYMPEGNNPEPIRLALNTRLAEATVTGSELFNKCQLPADLPEMFRSVLEEKRSLGSETTFIAGRVDLPGTDFPEGRVVFAWLGDSRLRLWNVESEITQQLPGEFKTMERWSSKRGCIGNMANVYVSNIYEMSGIRRILAYTDGLSSIDAHTEVLSNQELQALIAQAGELPTSDDIAIIDILLPPWNSKL